MFQWRVNTIFSAWIVLIVGLYLPNTIYSIRWLAVTKLSSTATSNMGIFCDQLQGSLTTKQVRFCKKHPGFMESVVVGAVHAISECQFQFRTRRWNCSTLYENPKLFQTPMYHLSPNDTFPADESQINISRPVRRKIPRSEPRLSTVTPYPIVPAGTREAAFVHAISAAGVAHAVTRACSAGEIGDCGCDRTIRGTAKGFQWSGCSDNIDFGTTFSRSFVDARERQASRKAIKTKTKKRRKQRAVDSMTQALINLHNNEAGRKVIERNMRVECKCHGVSGSCELKTCWRAMPSFREVGELLKDKFDGATEVRPYKAGSRKLLVPRSNHYKPHTDSDLVYTSRSPDFCEYNVKIGSLGTHGRRCNRTSRGIDGCDLLCCNRGYHTWRESVVERCKCKFHWCCHVQCKTCIREVEVHSCV